MACHDGQMTGRGKGRGKECKDVTAVLFRPGDKEARERTRLGRRGARRHFAEGVRTYLTG